MSRPRKYAQIQSDRCRLSDTDNLYIPEKLFHAGLRPFAANMVADWRKQAGWGKRGRPGYFHKPTPNGKTDPLSILLVFDCLMRMETDGLITANALTRILIDNYDQVTWDPTTVGSILAGIADVVDDVLPDGHQPPLVRDRSHGITYYIVNDTYNAREWMGRARNHLAEVARRDIEATRAGELNLERLTVFDQLGNLE